MSQIRCCACTAVVLMLASCSRAAAPPSPAATAPPHPISSVVPVVSVATMPSADAASHDVDAMIRGLPDALAQSNDDAALEALAARMAGVPGVKGTIREGARGGLDVEFAAVLSAAHVAALLGMNDVHVVSGDVHQHSWHLAASTGDIASPYGRRIGAREPTYGGWHLRVEVNGRPEGPLPGLSAGASPAYPLTRYTATVRRLSIRAATK